MVDHFSIMLNDQQLEDAFGSVIRFASIQAAQEYIDNECLCGAAIIED